MGAIVPQDTKRSRLTVQARGHNDRIPSKALTFGRSDSEYVTAHPYHEDEDVWTFYAHLDEHLVVPEMRVVAGQAIGRVGNSTNGRAPLMLPRLHFELRVRTRGGCPPFPGPFRINNRDPEVWLRSRGVIYDRRGRLTERARRHGDVKRRVDPWPTVEVLRDFERPTPRPSSDFDDE